MSKHLVICVKNEGYPVALERRKVYVSLPDPSGERNGLMRIIDESGDDFLYPASYFRSIALPDKVRKAVLAA